jgi:RHS repeat-associated protein
VLWEPTATTNEYGHEAIDPSGSIDAGFVVYDNPNGMVDGRWDSVTFDGIYTTFVDDHRNFNTNYDGKTFEFLMGIAGQTVPVDQVLGGNLQVLGEQTGSVSANDRYRGPKLSGSGAEEETNSGFWWEDPTYAAGETTLVAEPSATFKSHQVGWRVCVNTQRPSYYTITGVSGSSLTVEGDLTSPLVAEAGDWFRVIAPYAVDSDTGKLPENPWPDTPRASLYAGYRYMPPEVGTPSGGEVQAGDNEKGRYHCFNRDYDPHTGSWTTPDPAASPWGNLQDYVGGKTLQRTDPSGLLEYKKQDVPGAEGLGKVVSDPHDLPTGKYGSAGYLNLVPKNKTVDQKCKDYCSPRDYKATATGTQVDVSVLVPTDAEAKWSAEVEKKESGFWKWKKTHWELTATKKKEYTSYKVTLGEWDCECECTWVEDLSGFEIVYHSVVVVQEISKLWVPIEQYVAKSTVEIEVDLEQIMEDLSPG